MAKTLIVTFIAQDRPGVVEQLSEVVTENGGNWLDSRMAHLADSFAGVARISIADDKRTAVETALTGLAEDGFQVLVRDAGADANAAAGPILSLNLVGPDHPGIVHEITRAMASMGISVEEMETWTDAAPHGGGSLFYAQAMIRLPKALSEDDFRDKLEASANALMVDIDLGEDA